MANQIAELDAHLELLAQVADELEKQVAPCPTTRPMLIAWLTEWIRSTEALSEIRRELPRLPQVLKSAYSEWNHLDGGQ
ncbi:hypothetical protein Q5O_10460 [Pseudomonas putida JB]|jgi:hypothetical protein|uniref:hypothetical protein n=1 Tax=Pseudomonas TaxID=286 RepID=UPI000877ED15|nr:MULTISPECIES: hypothetical protein [Pseudomonas]AOX11866.1 hypothetical protein Q5O_10460 [Pseudomonas putida JB]MDN4512011.1 hypothetical protein [Pseudomonas sp. 2,4-D]